MKLNGKNILIVGASGGIGKPMSRRFYREGANLILSARDRVKLEAVAADFDPARVVVIPADASDPEQVMLLLGKAKERFHPIHAIIVSAGKWDRLSVDSSLAEAKRLVEAHYRGIFLPSFWVGWLGQKFLREQEGGGLLVNISSQAATRVDLPGNLTYAPFKAAAWVLMSSLMAEIKDPNVRIVDLKPAIVNTEEIRPKFKTPEDAAAAVQPEAIADWIIDHFDDSDDQLPMSHEFPSSVTLD